MSDKETDSIETPCSELDLETKGMSAEELLQKELEESKDKYMRLLADSENTRKRLQKEKQEMIRFSMENVITDFLTPMDNLEKALHFAGQASQETANWAKGFEMILDQFKEILSNHGVTPFLSTGALFDPREHEAVEMEVSDALEEGIILEEYVKGYKSKERVIRPARVKVAKKSASKTEMSESAPDSINEEKE